MLGRPHLHTPLGGSVATLVHEWSVASAQRARRNAMVATTACAQRRAEREDVADYLAARETPASPAGPGTEPDDVRRRAAARG